MLNNQEIHDAPVLIKDLGMLFPTKQSKQKTRYGIYKCHCKNEFKCSSAHINSGHTKTCGCSKNKHGLTNHELSSTWYGMMARCYNKKNNHFEDYGGRGIKVCEKWKDISNFIEDMYPTYKEGLTLDRKNPNGNYEPSNCRWANQTTQNRNTRILQKNNTSGFRGVSYLKNNKYRAYIVVDYKQIHLGLFNDKIDAAKAYDEYVIKNNLEHQINGVQNV